MVRRTDPADAHTTTPALRSAASPRGKASANANPQSTRSHPDAKTRSAATLVPDPHTEQPTRRRLFQIRTPAEIYELATRLAAQHGTQRSRLDQDLYERGLLVTAALLGPGSDGSYAGGLSAEELARRLRPVFARLFELLDEQQMLPAFVYRVLPPGTSWPPAGFLLAPGSAAASQPQQGEETSYELSQSAQIALDAFPDEI